MSFPEHMHGGMRGQGLIAHVSGPPSLDPHWRAAPNPAKAWLTEEAWAELQYVSTHLPALHGFAADLAKFPPRLRHRSPPPPVGLSGRPDPIVPPSNPS